MNFFAQRRWFAVFLLCSFIGLQAVLLSLVYALQHQQADAERLSAVQLLATQRAQLEGLLNANLVSVRGLRAEFLTAQDVSQDRFERLTSHLLDDDLHTRHLAVAPDMTIQYIYPRAGNEAVLGLDYREETQQLPGVLQAIETNDVVIQGPIELLQGGDALIARIPVITDAGEVWGVISQVIDHRRLFADAGIGRGPDNQMDTALRNQQAHMAGNEDIWQLSPMQLDVNIGTERWLLAAYPTKGIWGLPFHHYWPLLVIGNLMIAGILVLFILVFSSHRRLQHAFDLITRQAQTDPLTGLSNRSHLRHLLDDYIEYCKTRDEKFCVLFIDLDHFKQINDSLGHDLGDQLLIEVAVRLRYRLRDRDLVARLGGDEFIVVLKNVPDLDTSLALAGQLQHCLAEPMHIGGHTLHTHASIGIALYPNDGEDVATLLQHSDAAMYSAKAAGRNTSAFFDVSMQRTAESHLQLSEDIRAGVKKHEFQVFYQPILRSNGEVSHVEALLRWEHPTQGLLGPAHFIEVAERSGAIHGLGDFVLQQACADLKQLQARWPQLKLTVNRSSAEFNDAAVAPRWLSLIRETGVKPEDVIFEITESMLMPEQARQQAVISELERHGIGFAIDDFGTGYSSVNYVRRFPISLLKIDRSFISALPHDSSSKAMVGALVQMAQALNIGLVAEGVAEEGQARCLQELGVDYLQGFLFTKPLPLERIVAWLEEKVGVSQ